MAQSLRLRRGGKGLEHEGFAIAADRGMGHHPLHFVEHGRAHHQQGYPQGGAVQRFDRVDARLADGGHARGDPGGHDLPQAQGGLAHPGHGDADAAEAIHQGAGVVVQALEMDLQPRRLHAASEGWCCGSGRSWGKARSTIATSDCGEQRTASVTGRQSSAWW